MTDAGGSDSRQRRQARSRHVDFDDEMPDEFMEAVNMNKEARNRSSKDTL